MSRFDKCLQVQPRLQIYTHAGKCDSARTTKTVQKPGTREQSRTRRVAHRPRRCVGSSASQTHRRPQDGNTLSCLRCLALSATASLACDYWQSALARPPSRMGCLGRSATIRSFLPDAAARVNIASRPRSKYYIHMSCMRTKRTRESKDYSSFEFVVSK